MARVLAALLVVLGFVPTMLHAAPASTCRAVDARTDLASSYVGGRYYSSLNGRFTTVDPLLDFEQALVEPQLWNRYAYVTNNPFRFMIPTGVSVRAFCSTKTSERYWQEGSPARSIGAPSMRVASVQRLALAW